MNQLTIRVRLKIPKAAYQALGETVMQYTDSFNRVCKAGWNQKRINGVDLHHKTYKSERQNTDLPAQLVCSARAKATEAIKAVRTHKRKAKKSKSTKKRNRIFHCPQSEVQAIRYDARSSKIDLGKGYATLASIYGRQKVYFRLPDYYKNRIGWKVCSADLVTKNRKPYLHIVVSKPAEEVPIRYAVGIDLGVNRPAVTSTRQFLGERRWREVHQKYFRLKKALQAKGTDSAKRHLKKLARKENRFRRDCDHVISKHLVKSHEKGTLFVLEDLTDIRDRVKARKKTKRRIHAWSFSRLKFFLEYKAKLYGHAVDFVDPRYTSQKCSKCGHIDKKNRKTQSHFECCKCGFRCNADLNAAINIRNNYLASRAKLPDWRAAVNQPIVSSTYKPLPLGRGG